MLVARLHHQFSVAEYEQMIDLGILTENDRVDQVAASILLLGGSVAGCGFACVTPGPRRPGSRWDFVPAYNSTRGLNFNDPPAA
jgi:hypothetical protein